MAGRRRIPKQAETPGSAAVGGKEAPWARPSLKFDNVIRGFGRIRVRSGTTDPEVLRELKKFLVWMARTTPPRLDWLEAVRDGTVSAYDLLVAARAKGGNRLIREATIRQANIRERWLAWVAGEEMAERTAEERRYALAHLERQLAPQPLTLVSLPEAIKKYKTVMQAAKRPAMFNRVRAAALAFVRDERPGGVLTPVHRQIRAITKLREVKLARSGPTIAQAIQIRDALPPVEGRIWWGMFVTGMGPAEYAGDWSLEVDHVHIAGTKRDSRDRVVPMVWPEMCRETRHPRTVQNVIAALAAERNWYVEVYDARRGFKQMLEDARLPRNLVDTYMGHSIRGKSGQRYGVRELAPRFEDGTDATVLRSMIAAAEAEVASGKARPPKALQKSSPTAAEADVASGKARSPRALQKRAPKGVKRPRATAKSPRKSPKRGTGAGTGKAVKP